MTPQEKATQFVKRFPLLFDNPIDHEHWVDHLTELIESGNESKRTPDQQGYLDKCAIAAMRGMLANSIDTNQGMQPFWSMEDSKIASIAYDIAEAMLAERERRKLS